MGEGQNPVGRKRGQSPIDELAPLLQKPEWTKVSALVWKAVLKEGKKDMKHQVTKKEKGD